MDSVCSSKTKQQATCVDMNASLPLSLCFQGVLLGHCHRISMSSAQTKLYSAPQMCLFVFIVSMWFSVSESLYCHHCHATAVFTMQFFKSDVNVFIHTWDTKHTVCLF